MVSMKDIARRCGVSVATVSKALNGMPDIGEETRKIFGEPRRLFKMSPIHHHFEMCGMKETSIVLMYAVVTLVLSALAVVSALI